MLLLAGLGGRPAFVPEQWTFMGSRGAGIMVKTSVDEGRTWSRATRISPCSGMMGMIETRDGRVLVVFHEGFRQPTRIRAQYFRVRSDGLIYAS